MITGSLILAGVAILGILIIVGVFVWAKMRESARQDLLETRPGRKRDE